MGKAIRLGKHIYQPMGPFEFAEANLYPVFIRVYPGPSVVKMDFP
jgi:hypothetical protein